MIHFVTDIRSPTEPNILAGHEHNDLVLVPLETTNQQDAGLRFSAPETGWTHEELCRYADMVATGSAYLVLPDIPLDRDSAQWVGSSEV